MIGFVDKKKAEDTRLAVAADAAPSVASVAVRFSCTGVFVARNAVRNASVKPETKKPVDMKELVESFSVTESTAANGGFMGRVAAIGRGIDRGYSRSKAGSHLCLNARRTVPDTLWCTRRSAS